MTKYTTDIFYSADSAILNNAKDYVEQTYSTQCVTCNNFLFITEKLAAQKSTNELYESVYHEIIYSLEHMLDETTDIAQECLDAAYALDCVNERSIVKSTFDELIDVVFYKHGDIYVHNGSDNFYTKDEVVKHMFWMYSTNSYKFSDKFDKTAILNKLS